MTAGRARLGLVHWVWLVTAAFAATWAMVAGVGIASAAALSPAPTTSTYDMLRLTQPATVSVVDRGAPSTGVLEGHAGPDTAPIAFNEVWSALASDYDMPHLEMPVSADMRRVGTASVQAGPALSRSDRAGVAANTAAGANSVLRASSEAAFRAADDPAAIFIKDKHLASSVGRWAKFDSTDIGEVQGWVSGALRSEGAAFKPNNLADTFKLEANMGRAIGTRGETGIRAIVTNDGRVINAFPINAG